MIERKKRRISVFLFAIMLTLSISACTKRYVGRRVSYSNPYMCTCFNLPKACTTNTRHFTFDFEISKGDTPGVYVIEGGATYKGAGGFSTLREGSVGGFDLLLARGGEIIDSLSLMLRGTDLDHRISFRRTFKSQGFDAVGITYQIVVSG